MSKIENLKYNIDVNLSNISDTGNCVFSDQKTKVKKLHPEAIIPTKSRETDAGYDLYALEDTEIYSSNHRISNYDTVPCGPKRIKTGIALAVPKSWVGIIKDRSGLGSQGLKVHGGVIDYGYTGDISVCLSYNGPHQYYHIKKGDRIAQLLIVPCPHFELEEVEELDESGRGEKGFGSSGK